VWTFEVENSEVFSFRELAELLGRRMGLHDGRQRLELLFENGRLVETFTHSRIGSGLLEQLLVDLHPRRGS
jgi:hypothetical protein